jgi:hypothetical protein
LSSDPSKLSKHASPATQKPYKWDEISDTEKHNKILEMADNAATHLEQYYALGEYKSGVARENWVAACYLWHSFRNNKSKVSKRGKDPKSLTFS